MEIEKQVNPFKNPDWDTKKKEFKIKRNQRHNKNLKQILLNEQNSGNKYNYMSIEQPKSKYPIQKYCDITGFETNYKDKQSQMYYSDKFVYQQIKIMSKPIQDQYLSLRKVIINN